jgi:hypothetical protein
MPFLAFIPVMALCARHGLGGWSVLVALPLMVWGGVSLLRLRLFTCPRCRGAFFGPIFGGALAAAACSSADNSCPYELPTTGEDCQVPPDTSSTPGAVPECNYVTDTNECGAAFCVCSNGKWSCGPTCVITDGSFQDHDVVDAAGFDVSAVDGKSGADGAAEASGER